MEKEARVYKYLNLIRGTATNELVESVRLGPEVGAYNHLLN